MISDDNKYTLLLSSLPVHPTSLFSSKVTPVSRIQLDNRLKLLDKNDATDLKRIESLLHWSNIMDREDDALISDSMSEIEQIRSQFLKSIVIWRLELRTVVSALRKRNAGYVFSPDARIYGFGKWPWLIAKNWHETDFGVGHLIPWISDAYQFIQNNEPFELEKLLLNTVWEHYNRVSLNHYFDFPAVVVYVLRWDIINRWVSYDEEKALNHFDSMVSDLMKNISWQGIT